MGCLRWAGGLQHSGSPVTSPEPAAGGEWVLWVPPPRGDGVLLLGHGGRGSCGEEGGRCPGSHG